MPRTRPYLDTSAPQTPTQSVTIHDLKELLKELIEAKPTGPAQVSEAPQTVEPVTSGDAKAEEHADEKFQTYKTVNEV